MDKEKALSFQKFLKTLDNKERLKPSVFDSNDLGFSESETRADLRTSPSSYGETGATTPASAYNINTNPYEDTSITGKMLGSSSGKERFDAYKSDPDMSWKPESDSGEGNMMSLEELRDKVTLLEVLSQDNDLRFKEEDIDLKNFMGDNSQTTALTTPLTSETGISNELIKNIPKTVASIPKMLDLTAKGMRVNSYRLFSGKYSPTTQFNKDAYGEDTISGYSGKYEDPTDFRGNYFKNMEQDYKRELKTMSPIVSETIDNLSFSLTSIEAGLLGSIPGTAAGNPIIGAGGGLAAAGGAAFKMSKKQIEQHYLEVMDAEKVKKTGEGLTRNEEIILLNEFEPYSNEYALWEAGPEAVAGALGAGILTAPFKKMTIKGLDTKVAKNLMEKVLGIKPIKLAKFYGGEMGTEAITEIGQSNALVDAGLASDKMSFKDVTDWWEATKKVAPQTFILTTLMGGGVSLSKKLNTLANELEESGNKGYIRGIEGGVFPQNLYDRLSKEIIRLHDSAGKLKTNQAGFTKIPGQHKELEDRAKESINKGQFEENFVRDMIKRGYEENEARGVYQQVKMPKEKTWGEIIDDDGKLSRGDEDLRNMGIPTREGKALEEWGQELYLKKEELNVDYSYLDGTQNDNYQSFKKRFRNLKKLREIEDVEQLRKSYPSIPSEELDNLLWHQELNQDEVFQAFKERRILDGNMRGVKMAFNEEMKQFKKEYAKYENKRVASRDTKVKPSEDPKKIMGTKNTIFITRRRDTILKDRVKAIVKGARQGSIATRKEIKQAQDFLYNALKDSNLDNDQIKQFIPVLKSIKSKEDLIKKTPEIERRISDMIETRRKSALRKEIDKALKGVKPEKGGKKPKGIFNAEIHKIFDKIIEAKKLTKEEAKEKLLSNLKEYMGKDAMNIPYETTLENRILERFNANSTALEQLLMEIEQLKTNGRLEGFKRIYERQENKNRETGYLIRQLLGKDYKDVDVIEERLRSQYLKFKEKFSIPTIEMSTDVKSLKDNSGIKDIDSIFNDNEYNPNEVFTNFKEARLYAKYPGEKLAEGKPRKKGWNKLKEKLISPGYRTVLDWYGHMSVLDLYKESTEISLAERYSFHKAENKFKSLMVEGTDLIRNAIVESYNIPNKTNAINIAISEFNKEINLGEFKFFEGSEKRNSFTKEFTATKGELIKMYMEMQDPSLQEEFFINNGWSVELMETVENSLSKQDKIFGLKQLKIYKMLYDLVNPVYAKLNGIDLPFNKFYSPIRRDTSLSGKEETKESDVGIAGFLEEAYQQNSTPLTSAIGRVKNNNPIDKQDSLEVMFRHLREINYYIAFAEKANFVNNIFSSTGLRNIIKEKFGEGFMNSIDKQLETISYNRFMLGTRINPFDFLRKKLTVGKLALKPAIALKQLISTLAYWEVMSTSDFVLGVADFFKNPIENYRTLVKESEFIKTRGANMERDIKAALESDAYKQFSTTQSFMNFIMLNVRMGDKGAIILGSWAMRRAALKKGKYLYLKNQSVLPKENITEAIVNDYEEFGSATQQSGDISRQSLMQKGGSAAKLFTMFSSALRQYAQKEILTVLSLFREGGYSKKNLKKVAKTMFIYHTLLPVVFTWVSQVFGFGDDEEDAWKSYALAGTLGSLSGIYILSEMIEDTFRAAFQMDRFSSEVPIMDLGLNLADIVNDFHNIYSEISEDDISLEDFLELFESIITTTTLFGFPGEQIALMSSGGRDIMEENYKRGIARILGWTDYYTKNMQKNSKPPSGGSSGGGGYGPTRSTGVRTRQQRTTLPRRTQRR